MHYWIVCTSSYRQLLEYDERVRRDRRIPRCALRTFKYSSFNYLFVSGNNQALLNATGHDHRTFAILLEKFKPMFDTHYQCRQTKAIKTRDPSRVRGKPRTVTAECVLGLILVWFRTRGSCSRNLAILFGLTSTPMYRWLKFGRLVLFHVLSDDDDSKVVLPTMDKIRFYQEVIGDKYPLCSDVWGAADGLKLLIQKADCEMKQNYHYNGWLHSHYINCVFVFCPDGKIPLCLLNAPGTFHDSTMADYGIYEGMEYIFMQSGGKVVVDSAFNVTNAQYLIKSSQTDTCDVFRLRLNREATSIRQLSEWGMRMIQGSFPRLKEELYFEEKGDHQVILRLMVNLYNFTCTHIGIN